MNRPHRDAIYPDLDPGLDPHDRGDFDTIVRQTEEYVWRWLLHMGLPESDRADAQQEVFTRAYDKRSTYDARLGKPSQWLYGFAANVAYEYHRSPQRWREARLAEAGPLVVDRQPTPERAAMISQKVQHLDSILDKLPWGKRTLYIAHERDGIALEVLAKAHKIAERTAREWHRTAGEYIAREYARQGRDFGVVVLPISLHALLAADGLRPPMPDSVREAVRQAVQSRRDRDDARDRAERPSSIVPMSRPPREPAKTPAAPQVKPQGPGGALTRALLNAVPGAVAGGVVAAVMGALGPRFGPHAEPAVLPEPAAVVMSASEPEATAALSPAPVFTPSATAAPSAAPITQGALLYGADALAEETRLFDIARIAFGRGDANATLSALSEHAKQFPRGKFAGERERLWMTTLVQAGRTAEAQARLDRVRHVSPKSPLVTQFEAILREKHGP